MKYAASTDASSIAWALYNLDKTTTMDVEYDGGSVTISPTVTMGAGRLLTVDVGSTLDTEAVYVRAGGKLTKATANGDGTFSVMYPFNAPFELYAVAYEDDYSAWGMWEDDFTPQSQLLKAYPACHAWTWGGGSFLLEVTADSYMVTDRKLETTNEVVTLDSREYQSVLFSKTMKSKYAASGVIKHGLTESDKAQLMQLLNVHHAYYRSPHGDVANVAITSVNYVDHRTYTEVNIEMIQETV